MHLLRGVCGAQGHFQIMFSKYCPLAQRKLSLFMKIMYCSGVWSYIVGALTAPLYIIIPLLTIWAGMFPIVVSWWAAGEGTAPILPTSIAIPYRSVCLNWVLHSILVVGRVPRPLVERCLYVDICSPSILPKLTDPVRQMYIFNIISWTAVVDCPSARHAQWEHW